LLTDFVCLYTYEFWLSLCKIVRSSVILLLPLFASLRNHYVRIREIGDDYSCFVLTYFPFVNFEKKNITHLLREGKQNARVFEWQNICSVGWTCSSTDSRLLYGYNMCFYSRRLGSIRAHA
jgi:Gpi18-like mannosyltransferase